MRENTLSVLAIDLGAESGRVIAVHFDGEGLKFDELHRFPNIPVRVRGTLYWDIIRLWGEIKIGIDKGKKFNPVSIGVDTWGIDFGLLDEQGKLIGNPVHYRDERTNGMMDKVFNYVPREEVFAQTGCQLMQINTLYQIMNLVDSNSSQLQHAKTFLTIPDLLNYWLTGVKVCEYSIATTTQMFNGRSGTWSFELLDQLGIPTHIFPQVIQPGTKIGAYEGIPVIAPACHDTGSAVAGVPALNENFAYISSGTWSLVGLELEQPIVSKAVLDANMTNEGGVYGTTRFLQNVAGMWLVQQSRKTWIDQGDAYSYDQLVNLAEEASPLRAFVDVNHHDFILPGNHPLLVSQMTKESGQFIPKTKGEILRSIFESLALKYADVLDRLISLSDKKVETLHVVGGGSQNELLNQMTANATGVPVRTGPVEATVIGNALVQLITLGELGDLVEGRAMLGNIYDMKTYLPQDESVWSEAKDRYKRLFRN